jgi:hypothetical protein
MCRQRLPAYRTTYTDCLIECGPGKPHLNIPAQRCLFTSIRVGFDSYNRYCDRLGRCVSHPHLNHKMKQKLFAKYISVLGHKGISDVLIIICRLRDDSRT